MFWQSNIEYAWTWVAYVHVCVCVCVWCVFGTCICMHMCAGASCTCVYVCAIGSHIGGSTHRHICSGCHDLCMQALFNKRADLAVATSSTTSTTNLLLSWNHRHPFPVGKHIIQSTMWLPGPKMRSLLLLLLLLHLLLLLYLLGWWDICSHLARCFQLPLFRTFCMFMIKELHYSPIAFDWRGTGA